jgi:glutaredoxin-like protein
MFEPFGLDMTNVENKFAALKHEVKLVFFTRESHCAHCNVARKLFERMASVTRKIRFEAYNFAINVEKDQEYGVFAVPALALIGAKDYGIRYYGYPHGTELNYFLDDIVYISRGENMLPAEASQKLSQLNQKIQLKAFISPACPYSLPLVKTSIRLAVASDNISVDIIDAMEFLDIAEKYGVRGIPMTVVNEQKSFYGALKDEEYIDQILKLA